MREQLSTQEFKNRFAKLTGSKRVLDHELQALIEDALFQASHPDSGGSGSCNKLDHIVHGLAGQRSWPIKAIRTYIGEHTTATWETLKDGRKGYKYGDDNAPSVTMPEQTWWEHKASNENSATALNIHVANRINGLFRDAGKDGAKVDDPELLEHMKRAYQYYVEAKKAFNKEPQPVTEEQDKAVA